MVKATDMRDIAVNMSPSKRAMVLSGTLLLSSLAAEITTQQAKIIEITPATEENLRLDKFRRRHKGNSTRKPTRMVIDVRPAA
jgi:deoxyxylulose-5-phosphate synthase